MLTAVLATAFVATALALAAVSAATLWWMLHAWRTPESFEGTGFPEPDEPRLSFSLIMPCRDEPLVVMETTLGRLLAQSHPRVEIIVSVGDDDTATVANAHLLAAQHPGRVRVSVNTDPVKNKPRQLNSALAMCRNEVVGVIDAESLTHPDLLVHVDTTLRLRDADVVQGAVHLVNHRSRWFTLRNCLEYRVWFRSRLHGHAAAGFIPLGGNTVFIYRDLLRSIGGWDPACLAEDCEIGVRLSAMAKRVVCVYDPALTTLEEAPETVPAFLKQRTRWALGFMQVLAKGGWRALPTRARRAAAVWALVQQYAMAASGVVLPLGVLTALFLDAPTWVVMITYVPLVPVVLTVAFEALVLHEFGRDMRLRVTLRDYVVLVVSTPFYHALVAYASLRALVKFHRSSFEWEKTPHSGAHLDLTGAHAGAPVTVTLPAAEEVRV